MKFSIASASLFFAGAFAMPTAAADGYDACQGGALLGNPQCCSTDLLNLIGVDCRSPVETPTDAANFQAICAKSGQRARCCALGEVASETLIRYITIASGMEI
ncbi:unnamed protein product [Clonostachys chloroleuca]|uniref:Uncharacterized protein n=1 Tax=Clonostachys chloroleuca TaxID=1926264 RepID=A0AA35M1V9_9HYPO|nr:unnamed protein product [Clonostachys chloroleuca]